MGTDDPVKAAISMFTSAGKAIGLTGTKLEDYVHQHMTKAGYRAKVTRTYSPGKSGGGDKGGFLAGFFSSDSDDDSDDDE